MRQSIRDFDRNSQMVLIGLRIHNNCMKTSLRQFDEYSKLKRQLQSRSKTDGKLAKLQKKKLNFIQNIFEFFTDKRWHTIQNRRIKINIQSYKIAIKCDRLNMLARYNYKQSKML